MAKSAGQSRLVTGRRASSPPPPRTSAGRGGGGRRRDGERYLAVRAFLAVGVRRSPRGKLRDQSLVGVEVIGFCVIVGGGGGAGPREPSGRFLRGEGSAAEQDSVQVRDLMEELGERAECLRKLQDLR